MFCIKCGAKMYDNNAEFCNVCGAPLRQKNNKTLYQNRIDDRYNNHEQENEEEWLNEEAIKEIWNVPQSVNQSGQDEDLLPDGTPEWLNEIKQEEEYEEYKSKFHIMEHPLILTSIVAFFMLIISAISIVIIWNV